MARSLHDHDPGVAHLRQAIRGHRQSLTVFVFAAMMAVIWITATPFSWDNDEAAHYWTARDIYEAGELPGPDAFPEIILPGPPFEEAGLYRYHALPPTYYAVTALLFNLNPSRIGDYTPGLLAGRLLSGILYTAAVVLIYGLARDLSGGRRSAAALIAIVCGLVPKMASLGGSFTADSFALAASVFVTWATLRAVRREWSWGATAIVGAAAALVIMSRPSALPILLVPGFMFILSFRRGVTPWLKRGSLLLAAAVLPNGWWLIRNWRNLGGDLLGATTHLDYLDLRGLPYGTNEVNLFKATETGFGGVHKMLLGSDWLLRFNTRVWLSERYDDGSGLGMLLAMVLLIAVLAAAAIAGGGWGGANGGLSVEVKTAPLLMLAAFVIAAGFAAMNSYNDGIFVVGRFALPSLVLFLAATTAIVSRRADRIGRLAAPLLASVMLVVHLAFWGGFLLPDLLRQIGPA